jgi:tRNA threonylcarbamoyladenosine biosynthesis protein TsaB
VVDGRIVSEEEIQEKNVHAENIMRLVDVAITRSELSLQQLDAIAISIGPGSFTGLRIGLSVAKGLCFALDKPLVAVPTLEALARRAIDADVGAAQYVLAALDARRDEVYCQLFKIAPHSVEAVWQERDMTLGALAEAVDKRYVVLTGDAAAKMKSFIHAEYVTAVPEKFTSCSAATIALVGERMAIAGRFVDVSTIEPKYLKDFYTKRAN